jgi:hypothetical protein
MTMVLRFPFVGKPRAKAKDYSTPKEKQPSSPVQVPTIMYAIEQFTGDTAYGTDQARIST